ncbi:hypothetical protein AGLY_000556 [Aphis glycines]|uniref:Uncharacterized protein n=1 Tax=Aphis glycines TaxID=307491 RepID=A0A6G0U7T6_APHGL|nr:hypothetical protein AGLY_000556 [Aphis glycines]
MLHFKTSGVYNKKFLEVFKKIRKNNKRETKDGNFHSKPVFYKIQNFFYILSSNSITNNCKYLKFSPNVFINLKIHKMFVFISKVQKFNRYLNNLASYLDFLTDGLRSKSFFELNDLSSHSNLTNPLFLKLYRDIFIGWGINEIDKNIPTDYWTANSPTFVMLRKTGCLNCCYSPPPYLFVKPLLTGVAWKLIFLENESRMDYYHIIFVTLFTLFTMVYHYSLRTCGRRQEDGSIKKSNDT